MSLKSRARMSALRTADMLVLIRIFGCCVCQIFLRIRLHLLRSSSPADPTQLAAGPVFADEPPRA